MEARLNLLKVAPKGAYQAMAALQQYVDTCGIERPLLELVKIRASQINGCAYCIDMHTKDARALGESEQRIYLLDAWRESPFYTDRERAALALDRSGHAHHRRPRPGRGLRQRQGAVQPRRARKPERRHRDDQ
jgi:AhpD family alkylhydroperoxidase